MPKPTESQFNFVPVEQMLEAPNGIVNHYKNYWWAVHPEKGIVFYGNAPQCNISKEIVESISGKLYPWAEIKFFPSLFRKINISDYN